MLPSAQASIRFVEKVLDTCLARAVAELAQGGLQWGTALDVRDACMLAMVVGHVGLTVRISVVRSVKATEFASNVCTHPECPLPAGKCAGNRLESIRQLIARSGQSKKAAEAAEAALAAAHQAGDEGDDEGEDERYQVWLPHHKTQASGISMPIVHIASAKLTKLLNIYQKHGRPLVR